MSELCLKEGSVLVPAVASRLRLYSMRFCPYAQRTRLVLYHKKIPHETINVNLKYKPSWFLERNSAGLVPIIEYQDHVICESSICDEYLEDEFPHLPLLPSSPGVRAQHRLFMYNFDKDISALHGSLSPDETKRTESEKRLQSLLERCETHLKTNNSKFMTGALVQMVDFHMWPFFERFPAMSGLRNDPVLPESRFPLLNKWVKVMEGLETVKLTRLPDQWHQEFLLSLAQRNPQYDIGLKEARL